MYKTIIFDFDGTLCSSITTMASALQHTFIHFGHLCPSMQKISSMCALGPDLHDTFTILEPSLNQLDPKDLQKWFQYYHKEYDKMAEHQSHLYPHVSTMLEKLRQQDVELIIVSQKNKETIFKTLVRFEIDHFFCEVYEPPLSNPGKPDSYLFEHEILPSRPSHDLKDFLMVGDTQIDIQFAMNCQIDVAWAEYGYGDIPKELLGNIKFHLHTPLDLIAELNEQKS